MFRLIPLIFLYAVLFGASITYSQGNTTNDSFTSAKKILERQVYMDHRVSFYCGASFDAQKRVILPEGFIIFGHEKRATKIEWEHAVPAEHFGRIFSAWREGDAQCVDNRGKVFKGRKCAEKMDIDYRYMQADMYNLFPAIGAVNALRSNKQYSELPAVQSAFGTCKARIDGNRFEPPERAKGQAARAALYMDETYPQYKLSRQQRQLFQAWDKAHPVDQWECTRAKRIEILQGNDNRFVKTLCQKAGLWK